MGEWTELKKKRFLFVYPPSVDPTLPPISLARIKPFAERYYPAEFLDENLEFLYHVISTVISKISKSKTSQESANLKEAGAILERDRGEKHTFDTGGPGLEKPHKENRDETGRNYANAGNGKDGLSDDFNGSEYNSFVDEILKAIAILKSPELFYNIKHYVAAYSVIRRLFEQFSSFYIDTEFGYSGAKLWYSPYFSQDIKMALADELRNPYIDFFKSRIRNYIGYDIIGISVIYTSQLIPALTLSSMMKGAFPDKTVILGGPAAYKVMKTLLDSFDFLDLIVPFDGEYFLEKCGSNLKRLDESCFGFHFFKTDLPDYSFSHLDRYLIPQSVLNLDITRGCYYKKCVFCAYGFDVAPYRVMDIKRTVDYISFLKESYNTEHLLFSVDVLDMNSLRKFAEEVVKRGVNISYYSDVRFEKKLLDRGFVRLLYESGLRVLSFGMESACGNTLKIMEKGINPDDFSAILKNVSGEGIHVNINLIHGFPGDSSRGLNKTLNFIENNRDYITTVGASQFTLLRKSKMERNYREYGIRGIKPHGDLYQYYRVNYNLPVDYMSFDRFLKRVLKRFPIFGRLTGSTSDYLLYASRYSPQEMKEVLRKAVELISG